MSKPVTKPTKDPPIEPPFEEVALILPRPYPTRMRTEDYSKLLIIMNENPEKRAKVMDAFKAYRTACNHANKALKEALKEALM